MQSPSKHIAPASFGQVAVLMGGSSAEREVSLMSGKGVLNALRSRGVDAFAFDPSGRSLEDLKRIRVDRVFIALHGGHGEDGTIQGVLESLRIPYTGSGVMASSIAMDKVTAKYIWSAHGLPTAKWCTVNSAGEMRQAIADLGLPVMVKPAHEGSSIGITKVTDESQCDAAYALAAKYDRSVLVEQYIDGDEVTGAVLCNGSETTALPLVRIVAPGGNYDFQNKYYSDETQYFCPSGLPATEHAAIQTIIVRAFKALGCYGWGRAEVMIRRSDRAPFLLEMNTCPGMTSHSLVPMAAKEFGMSYEDLCLHLLASARLHT